MDSAGAGTLYLVHVLTHASRNKLDAALAHLELSSFQYTALSVLVHNENLSSSQLSRRFHVTPQAMGELILLLERRGLIERREDTENKRTLLLSLTEHGQAVWARADVIAKKIERDIFGDLSDAEMATLRSILNNALAVLRDQPAEKRKSTTAAHPPPLAERRRSARA